MQRQANPSAAVLRAAFSLVELVVVIVIIGVIAAIAVPRFSGANARAALEQTENIVAVWQDAVRSFVAEHDQSFVITEDALNGDQQSGAARGILTARTHKNGTVDSAGAYGPYLRSMLSNPMRGHSASRFIQTDVADGAVVPGAGPEHGWIFTLRGGSVAVGYIDSQGRAGWVRDRRLARR